MTDSVSLFRTRIDPFLVERKKAATLPHVMIFNARVHSPPVAMIFVFKGGVSPMARVAAMIFNARVPPPPPATMIFVFKGGVSTMVRVATLPHTMIFNARVPPPPPVAMIFVFKGG